MKNIKKTLEEKKEKVQKQFEQLDAARKANIAEVQRLNANTAQILEEMARLQGEWRSLEALQEDFQDEPKNKE